MADCDWTSALKDWRNKRYDWWKEEQVRSWPEAPQSVIAGVQQERMRAEDAQRLHVMTGAGKESGDFRQSAGLIPPSADCTDGIQGPIFTEYQILLQAPVPNAYTAHLQEHLHALQSTVLKPDNNNSNCVSQKVQLNDDNVLDKAKVSLNDVLAKQPVNEVIMVVQKWKSESDTTSSSGEFTDAIRGQFTEMQDSKPWFKYLTLIQLNYENKHENGMSYDVLVQNFDSTDGAEIKFTEKKKEHLDV